MEDMNVDETTEDSPSGLWLPIRDPVSEREIGERRQPGRGKKARGAGQERGAERRRRRPERERRARRWRRPRRNERGAGEPVAQAAAPRTGRARARAPRIARSPGIRTSRASGGRRQAGGGEGTCARRRVRFPGASRLGLERAGGGGGRRSPRSGRAPVSAAGDAGRSWGFATRPIKSSPAGPLLPGKLRGWRSELGPPPPPAPAPCLLRRRRRNLAGRADKRIRTLRRPCALSAGSGEAGRRALLGPHSQRAEAAGPHRPPRSYLEELAWPSLPPGPRGPLGRAQRASGLLREGTAELKIAAKLGSREGLSEDAALCPGTTAGRPRNSASGRPGAAGSGFEDPSKVKKTKEGPISPDRPPPAPRPRRRTLRAFRDPGAPSPAPFLPARSLLFGAAFRLVAPGSGGRGAGLGVPEPGQREAESEAGGNAPRRRAAPPAGAARRLERGVCRLRSRGRALVPAALPRGGRKGDSPPSASRLSAPDPGLGGDAAKLGGPASPAGSGPSPASVAASVKWGRGGGSAGPSGPGPRRSAGHPMRWARSVLGPQRPGRPGPEAAERLRTRGLGARQEAASAGPDERQGAGNLPRHSRPLAGPPGPGPPPERVLGESPPPGDASSSGRGGGRGAAVAAAATEGGALPLAAERGRPRHRPPARPFRLVRRPGARPIPAARPPPPLGSLVSARAQSAASPHSPCLRARCTGVRSEFRYLCATRAPLAFGVKLVVALGPAQTLSPSLPSAFLEMREKVPVGVGSLGTFLTASSDLAAIPNPSPCDLGPLTLDEPLLLGTPGTDPGMGRGQGVTCDRQRNERGCCVSLGEHGLPLGAKQGVAERRGRESQPEYREPPLLGRAPCPRGTPS
ncbi:collagen alpha-1(I) chain-like [Odocoileus virginianus]|uniref:Collagen alpha-1(I) chain-like n=1 Tax=Odocoileus virginianus TaxID=9874 RepID=A0ABM4J0K8_ODOVR